MHLSYLIKIVHNATNTAASALLPISISIFTSAVVIVDHHVLPDRAGVERSKKGRFSVHPPVLRSGQIPAFRPSDSWMADDRWM